MAGLLQYPCGGPTQVMLLPLAVLTFVGYSLTVPAVALWFLRSKRHIVKCVVSPIIRTLPVLLNLELFSNALNRPLPTLLSQIWHDSFSEKSRKKSNDKSPFLFSGIILPTVSPYEAWKSVYFCTFDVWSRLPNYVTASLCSLQMYWEFAILARKLGLVSVAVGLSNSASYQLAMMLLVLFIAFVAQVSCALVCALCMIFQVYLFSA